MASDHIRASDRDRDAVVATLRDAYTDGRLTLEEFQERTAAAYDGRTWGDLRELTTDLPVQPVLGADLPPPARPPEAQPAGPQPEGAQPPGAAIPGGQPPWGAVPGIPPWAYPPGGQVPGIPPAGMPLGHQPPAVPPYPPQAPSSPDMRSRQPRPRPFAPVVPVVGMWILFALATRSAGGAVAFLIAVALLVTLTSIGRRPPRGPSDQNRD
jgi:hypothetical protein